MKGGYVDDDIQFLAHDHPNKTLCQICSCDLTSLSVHNRQVHYDQHFSQQSSGSARPKPHTAVGKDQARNASSKPPSKSGFKPPSGIFSRTVPAEEQNIFWHASQASSPPRNFSPGLIPVLKKALTRSHEKGVTQKAWLAFERAVHVQGEAWDRSWGCGYRNYLMACAALMDQQVQPMYFPLLDAPLAPGVRNLQKTLEEAWQKGYDEEGAEQLQHRLVDTKKWIGTADIYVAFTYRGVPAQLVDFNDLRNGVDPLVQWIYNYFSGGDPHHKTTTVGEALRGARAVVVTDKLPIILQHEGHSRTIVGCERVKNGEINLLTFDPAKRILPSIREAGLHYHGQAPQAQSGPSKVIHKVMHPVETIKSKKRKSLEPPPDSSKRQRPSDPGARSTGEVIVIGSDSEEEKETSAPASRAKATQSDELNPNDVLKVFRIQPKSLKKKDKYQILYFPLSDPLTEQEKRRRRIVTSEKVA
ncbi:peptidase family C78-domain-containing protein [Cubamyces lactineus]|nr:peptidase family C78-domain-containing protein [Cubamyces lactineus]